MMKYIHSGLMFLLFVLFVVSFAKHEQARLAFEQSHQAYKDMVISFEKRHIKQQPSSLSDQFQLRKDLLHYAKKLAQDGWSYEAIEKGYLDHLKPKQASYNFEQLYQSLQVIGSPAFHRMWERQPRAQHKLEAKRDLNLLLTYVKMPEELSGQSAETKQLLKQFSPSLSPTDAFWDQLSSLVQLYYDHLEHIPYQTFNRKLYQLRYVLSVQQIEWVRNNYGRAGKTDADALARYLATLDESDYSLNESARYHNKVASHLDTANQLQITYPDNLPQANYKVLVHFHSEFILSEAGHFLAALDPQQPSQNGLINGSSFNYANQNNDLHRLLDIEPIELFEPDFIETAMINPNSPFIVPDLEQQNDQQHPIFSRDGKSSKQLTKMAAKAFKKLLRHYQQAHQSFPSTPP